MNEYTLEYLEVIAQNDLQRKMIDLISKGKKDEEILDELMKSLAEESDD